MEKNETRIEVKQPTVVNESKPYDVEYLYKLMRKRYAGRLRESHLVELSRVSDLLLETYRFGEKEYGEGFYDTALVNMAVADVFYEVLRVMTKRGMVLENTVKDMVVKMRLLNEGYPDCPECGKKTPDARHPRTELIIEDPEMSKKNSERGAAGVVNSMDDLV